MSLLGFFTSAVGGSLLGGLSHIATSAFDVWRKGKEAKIEAELIKARTEAAEKTEAWKAFTESQKTQGAIQIPENAPPWIAAFYLGVDGLSRSVRPLLTLIATAFIALVFWKSDAAGRAVLALEINFGAWTIIMWWFGARYQKK